MDAIIKNFGINPYLLIAQIINFVIILLILKRFAYKPILDLLEKRRQNIKEAQENAQKAQDALEKALDKEKEILANAQTQAKKILATACQQSEELIAKAAQEGRIQVEKMLKSAKEEIEKTRTETEKELALNVSRLAVDMLKKSMSGLIDTKEEAKIVEKVTKSLKTKV